MRLGDQSHGQIKGALSLFTEYTEDKTEGWGLGGWGVVGGVPSCMSQAHEMDDVSVILMPFDRKPMGL